MRRPWLFAITSMTIACASLGATSCKSSGAGSGGPGQTNVDLTVVGGGMVVSSPSGISTTSMQSATFSGSFTLTATAMGPDFIFGFWSVQLLNNPPPDIDTTSRVIELPPAPSSGDRYVVTAYFDSPDAGYDPDAADAHPVDTDGAGDGTSQITLDSSPDANNANLASDSSDAAGDASD
jgi:hypothetical protein